jgi:hypothetical protein
MARGASAVLREGHFRSHLKDTKTNKQYIDRRGERTTRLYMCSNGQSLQSFQDVVGHHSRGQIYHIPTIPKGVRTPRHFHWTVSYALIAFTPPVRSLHHLDILNGPTPSWPLPRKPNRWSLVSEFDRSGRERSSIYRRVALALHMIVSVIADPRAAGNWREASERRAG